MGGVQMSQDLEIKKSNAADLRGKEFNKWTVIGLPYRKNNHIFYKCRCECGTEKDVEQSTLKNGKSSGCTRCRNSWHTHHMSSSKLYFVWHGMIERCENKNHVSFKNYGGRGITVCAEWHDAATFLEWAESSGYKEGLTIERVDVNGNYCPQNCMWITPAEQSKNKRNSVKYTLNSVTKTQADWARSLGVASNTLSGRVRKYGVEKALTAKRGKHLC
jgi:hypothetical protein